MKNRFNSNFRTRNILTVFLVVLTIYSCKDSSEDLEVAELVSPSFTVENGTLVFSSKESMGLLLDELSQMSYEDHKEWCATHNFESARLAFETLVNEEGEIDDYWEDLIEEDPSIQLPEEGIHSPLYNKYMAVGVIAEIDDPEGSYYDYNFNEVGMSSVLNHDRKVIVDKKVYQYGLDAYYVTENDGLTTAFSYGFKEVPSNGRIAVANPDHAWQFFGTTNNGWYTKDKRRYKVWLEGSSKIVGATQEVTNIFRAQTQKKRFGKWKYYNTRSITISDAIIRVKQGTWSQYERDVFAPYAYLPLITSVPPVHEAIESNPFNWNGLVNNLYLNLWPHNYGIVRSSGIFSDNSDGVTIPEFYIDISVTFNGNNFVLARNGGINY